MRLVVVVCLKPCIPCGIQALQGTDFLDPGFVQERIHKTVEPLYGTLCPGVVGFCMDYGYAEPVRRPEEVPVDVL